jgi:signal transduction histidine kinase/ActR/RegA family two-component response regulator
MSSADLESSVLIYAPVGRDAALLSSFLSAEGICTRACNTNDELQAEVEVGCGMLFVTEEAMTPELQSYLSRLLSQQPQWSDLPIVLCVNATSRWNEVTQSSLTQYFGNITLLQRPIRKSTLLSSVHVSLRSRARQYQVRNYIDQCQGLTRQLKLVSQRKDDFLAMLGHELRNPLAAITSALDLMEVENLDIETAEEARRIAKRQSDQMTRIVNDLLDISRLLRGRVELHQTNVDAQELVKSAVETMQSQIAAHAHTLQLDMPSRPLKLFADEGRLRQVLENLLANSCKYTDPGGRIRITLDQVEGYARFCVVDNGSGFPEEFATQIFDLFAQGERTLDRSQGGLGIGLTVVREIVELHGGTITASSPGVNQGSQFSFLIPLADVSIGEVDRDVQPVSNTGSRSRVLIVEDNQDLANMMSKIVSRLGHEPLTINDGSQAVIAAVNFRPDVVLLDIGLPGLNGYQVAKELRANERTKSTLIVGLSGYSQEEDKQRSLDSGMDYHYPKPLDVTLLKGLLTEKHSLTD